MNRATPYELRAIADCINFLSEDTATQMNLTETDEGYTVDHELYKHILRLENGQELMIVCDFSVRWVGASFKGDYLQPADPDQIEAIEVSEIYAYRLYGSFEEELFAEASEVERLINDRSKIEQRTATNAALDRVMTIPA